MPIRTICPLCIIIFLFQILTGCSNVRTEFYREETKHLYTTGIELYKQGSYQEAQSAFVEVVELDPDYGPAHAALGNLAMIREDYQEALEHYRTAIEYDPELEEELLPLLLASTQHQVRQPLVDANVDLDKIHKLLLDENLSELEDVLKKDVPLQLLASDTISLTPGKLAELRRKAEDLSPTIDGSVRLRLFLAHILFQSETNDPLTIDLLNRIVDNSSKQEQQGIHLLLGRLHERTGDPDQAVNDYLAAVNAGLPMSEVAHYLARIYKVDIATIMPEKAVKSDPAPPPKIVSFSVSATSSVSFFPNPGSSLEPEYIISQPKTTTTPSASSSLSL